MSAKLKNCLFDVAVARGFDPAQFEWDKKSPDDRLVHRATGSHFVARVGEEGIDVSCQPWLDYQGWIGANGLQFVMLDFDIEVLFGRWLCQLREEIETVDMWALAGRVRRAPGSDAPDDKFTDAEAAVARKCIDDAADTILEHVKVKEEQATIERFRSSCKSALAHLGKFDWRNLVVGYIFTFVMNGIIEADLATGILTMISVFMLTRREPAQLRRSRHA